MTGENGASPAGEGWFWRMAEAIPEVIWMTELEPERVVYTNPSFERLWGVPVAELYRDPRRWIEGIHPDDRPKVAERFGRWVSGGALDSWEAEFRVVHRDGSMRWILERGVLVAAAPGETPRVCGISTDITQRKLAEAALRESDERFALAVQGASDGIWDWDILKGQMFLSHRTQQLFGLVPGVTTRPRDEWVALSRAHPDDEPSRLRSIEDCVAGLIPCYDGEWRFRQQDETYRWVRIRGLCVRDPSGRATRMAGSVSDIDAHKRAQSALQQAQRLEAVGTLASGIAHDFNNILGAILGFGEMLLGKSRAGSRNRHDIECILTAAERGRALVDRILAFSRSGGGAREPVHVESVLSEALNLLGGTLPENISLRSALDCRRAAVIGDPTQVHQVVMNLLANAVQAMPEGGTLQVAAAARHLKDSRVLTTGRIGPGHFVVISISDTGVGIAPAVRDRIFDPFFTTKKVGEGSGLGLSLVHGIVMEMDGALDVRSVLGRSSTFEVYLPKAGDVGGRASVPQLARRRGLHEQVLVVDDEEMLVRLLSDSLTGLGYVCVGFTSAVEALAAFRAHPDRFDALVTDERMPEMSGLELVRQMRALRASLPVVLLSGFIGGDLPERAAAADVSVVLGKPAAANELAFVLGNLLHPSMEQVERQALTLDDAAQRVGGMAG